MNDLDETFNPDFTPTDEAVPYEELAARYNRNLRHLDALWARAVTSMRWIDEDGRHYQQGEGHFMFRGDDEIALRVAKLETLIFWAGSNAEKFFLIDRYADPPTTYLGTHGVSSRGLPFAVQMTDLLQLLGMKPIDPTGGVVSLYEGALLVEPAGGRVRLLVEPVRFHPMRIDLLDADGYTVATCRMREYEFVDGTGVGGFARPEIAVRYAIEVPGEEGALTLSLSDLDPTRVRDTQFDHEFLMRAFATDRTVSLDD